MLDRLGNVVSGVFVEEIAIACASLGDRSSRTEEKNGRRGIRSIDQICQSNNFFPLSQGNWSGVSVLWNKNLPK